MARQPVQVSAPAPGRQLAPGLARARRREPPLASFPWPPVWFQPAAEWPGEQTLPARLRPGPVQWLRVPPPAGAPRRESVCFPLPRPEPPRLEPQLLARREPEPELE